MSKFNSYKELKEAKITTVGELIKRLEKLPADTKLKGNGSDFSGYGMSTTNYACINYYKDTVIIENLENVSYSLLEKKVITEKQYQEFER